uniref:FAD/NAD(P)-binding domain-containing protein n=2 Tax=Chlamydomonas euryale TaxID=1486919 RepID=A0A7R9VYQ0_9CHLO|mmetsp:Transcript_7913/g.23845  ORF Transcript_7913/g.23845 Transcript_7913/m.23845 type:complete len:197 (+) Transcript_7913:1135-1725(+)
MEEATFLTRYAEHVTIIHRFDFLEASKIMQKKALSNKKISVLWMHEVAEAYGSEAGLEGVKVVNKSTGEVSDLAISALFFAIGHSPATKFLDGQLELDDFGYIKCLPGSSETSVPGVFAAGDVKDPKYKQAVVAAGSGCIAALDAEHSLQALGGSHGSMSIDEIACSHWTSNVVPGFTGVQPRIAEQGVERAETGR